MTVFYMTYGLEMLTSSQFHVGVNYCVDTGSQIISSATWLDISFPTPSTAMRISQTVRQALSDFVNAKYSLSTTIGDVIPFSARGNLVRVPIDFGFIPNFQETSTTVTQAATWVTANSIIICQAQNDSSGDHEPEEAVLDGLSARAINLVPGVSFDVICYASEGTWGRYQVNCVGN